MDLNSKYCHHLRKGCRAFNQKDPWTAHEHWEMAWKDLPKGSLRTQLQAAIQIAAAIHLFHLGRKEPAWRLLRLAQAKWKRTRKRPGLPEFDLAKDQKDLASWLRERSESDLQDIGEAKVWSIILQSHARFRMGE
ncbi:MAG: DUF309 domain-containing protein [Bdellovibrionales bacterium]|nr:DUF309 domain-containing protein [Bdellovibrionales bacterium]